MGGPLLTIGSGGQFYAVGIVSGGTTATNIAVRMRTDVAAQLTAWAADDVARPLPTTTRGSYPPLRKVGAVTSGAVPPGGGLGLFVYEGPVDQLVTATKCPGDPRLPVFWAYVRGAYITYVPGASIKAVNAAFLAAFPLGIPAATPMVGRCS